MLSITIQMNHRISESEKVECGQIDVIPSKWGLFQGMLNITAQIDTHRTHVLVHDRSKLKLCKSNEIKLMWLTKSALSCEFENSSIHKAFLSNRSNDSNLFANIYIFINPRMLIGNNKVIYIQLLFGTFIVIFEQKYIYSIIFYSVKCWQIPAKVAIMIVRSKLDRSTLLEYEVGKYPPSPTPRTHTHTFLVPPKSCP